ncbi:GNAT family N-acetyltransferase [Simiduia sp. 21SJ11W-1]|uniref:GNAT family N-acetyltransferase n=1 Tax=Simiduia sp. 21SJ11W-1 TaxID=2909669 RepID=UPI00209F9138|nr:GNAT family N-acetyltransferase [Simiduia sp. 21SJ11W-1]UTA47113.1 GNAT family N-acetyltransferase [Simiduia sp. 21SJ11W-1]
MNINPTARLCFRLMDANDGDLLFELDQDPEVMRYINGGKVTARSTIDEVMIPRMAAYRNPALGWGLWAVNSRLDQAFLGWVLVRPMQFFSPAPDYQCLELGWRFKQAYWGKGFATEAAAQVAEAVAGAPGVRSLSAIALPGNTASIAVMKKLGMRYVKTDIHKDPLGDAEVVYYTRRLAT